MPKSKIQLIEANWSELVSVIMATHGVDRMQRVADACNAAAGTAAGWHGYVLGIEGENPLRLRDYRMTVMTLTDEAAKDNAKNNTLLMNFYLAGGD